MKKLNYLLLIALTALTSCYYEIDESYFDDGEETTTTRTEVVIQDEICLKIVDDLFRNFYGEPLPDPIIKNGKIKVSTISRNFRLKYTIEKMSKGGIALISRQGPRYRPDKIAIRVYNDTNYLVSAYGARYLRNASKITQENILYDQNGNRIPLSEQIRRNESRLLSMLDPITRIKDDDKAIFAAILSSKVMDSVDYLEKDNYLEAFCVNKEASYRFLIMDSKDEDGYWGLINKMGEDANLQSDNKDSSSEVYAFRISDKSTSTKRFFISLVRVVQNDMNNELDNGAKYGEASRITHIVNDYAVARGGGWFCGGADILARNEDTFTRKYLSEVSENIIYTYQNGKLELNGRSAYKGKVNKL